ncbi:hypothetical protein [Winogradskyella alexanderae]|uniref:Uncharacterized protein n=1 Tax=Winogradskyella alexanderae TaxID=2877123 RepID=A0ABS7XT76_9FLAO|nr:hypothetical protein [Winogradskyella alexanderae]MCA0132990.1 hypothetical protein [Winogradskyella alexanderae]
MLFANKIQKVSFSSNEYRLITEKSDTIFVSVDISANEKSVEMRLDNKEYVVTFDRIAENITVQNNTDNTIITYTELEGETKDIGKPLSVATTTLFYDEENSGNDYDTNYQKSNNLTLWCFRFRKSKCNNALQTITDYCGDEPSSIGGTDCGCLWGDFYCVCVTDFEC